MSETPLKNMASSPHPSKSSVDTLVVYLTRSSGVHKKALLSNGPGPPFLCRPNYQPFDVRTYSGLKGARYDG